MKRQALWLGSAMVAVAVSACATTETGAGGPGAQAVAPPQAMRHRPRRSAVRRALTDAAGRAAQCLPPSVASVNVAGGFAGATGEYHVDGVTAEQPLSPELRDCVREQFETARVDAFLTERFDAPQVVTHEGAPAEGTATAAATGAGSAAGATPTAVATPAAGAGATGATPVAGATAVQGGARGGATSAQGAVSAAGAGAGTSAAGTSANAATGATSGNASTSGASSGAGATAAGAGATAAGAGATGAGVGATTASARTTAGARTTANAGNAAGGRTATEGTAAAGARSGAGAGAGAETSEAAATAHPAAQAGPITVASVIGCYRGAVRTDPTLGGRLRLQFTVNPDGVVRNVHAQPLGTPTGRPGAFTQVARCIEARVRPQNLARAGAGDVDLALTLSPHIGGELSIERYTGGLLAGGEAGAGASEGGSGAAAGGGAAEGTLDLPQVAAIVRGRTDDIRTCYQNQLAHDANLQMQLRLRFEIRANGSVSSTSPRTVVLAGSPDAADAVANCVEGVVRTTAFPARPGTAGPLEATLPFNFAPTGAAATTASPATAAGAGTAAGGTLAAGRIDPARVSAVIRNNTGPLRDCYTRAVASDPALAGRITVHFTVDPAGRVTNVSSQPALRSGNGALFGNVAQCIEGVMQTLTLPPPVGGPANVALPFDFGPSM